MISIRPCTEKRISADYVSFETIFDVGGTLRVIRIYRLQLDNMYKMYRVYSCMLSIARNLEKKMQVKRKGRLKFLQKFKEKICCSYNITRKGTETSNDKKKKQNEGISLKMTGKSPTIEYLYQN